ncbi:MAG: non-homologous end-joining DNA ligase [Acidimicrobiales bacterium]
MTPPPVTAQSLSPMLATTGELPTRGGPWAYEVKWDGMRALAHCRPDGTVGLRARTGNDITGRYPELAELGQVAPVDAPRGDEPIVVDGEVVMFGDDGRPSFQALQHRMHIADPAVSRRMAAERSVVFVVFDVLWGPTGSVLDRTYDERREVLFDLEFPGAHVLVPSAELDDPDVLVEFCRSRQLEGIVSKRRDSRYRPGERTTNWIKTKFTRAQEFVVLGWTEGTGARSRLLGALLLGYHDDHGEMCVAGKVGTGFSDRVLAELRAELSQLAEVAPVADIGRQKTAVHWVEPTLVVQVGFSEWSPSGSVRHPTYQGRRVDVDPRRVVREP